MSVGGSRSSSSSRAGGAAAGGGAAKMAWSDSQTPAAQIPSKNRRTVHCRAHAEVRATIVPVAVAAAAVVKHITPIAICPRPPKTQHRKQIETLRGTAGTRSKSWWLWTWAEVAAAVAAAGVVAAVAVAAAAVIT